MIFLKKLYYKIARITPDKMPMVQYWKTKDMVQAKQTKDKNGSLVMFMEGEKYPFPTFPRSHLLFGPLSPLKHNIKVQVFNESWAKLEDGEDHKEIIKYIKGKLFNEIAEMAWKLRDEFLPPTSMCQSTKEIHRAWGAITTDIKHLFLRDYLCFILQEDDGYRMRFQWLAQYAPLFKWSKNPAKWFKKALNMLEHAEVIGDMKERIRLLRKILLLILEDPEILKLFNALFKEINWKKVKLTPAEKYHFRGKYFKVDYPVLEY